MGVGGATTTRVPFAAGCGSTDVGGATPESVGRRWPEGRHRRRLDAPLAREASSTAAPGSGGRGVGAVDGITDLDGHELRFARRLRLDSRDLLARGRRLAPLERLASRRGCRPRRSPARAPRRAPAARASGPPMRRSSAASAAADAKLFSGSAASARAATSASGAAHGLPSGIGRPRDPSAEKVRHDGRRLRVREERPTAQRLPQHHPDAVHVGPRSRRLVREQYLRREVRAPVATRPRRCRAHAARCSRCAPPRPRPTMTHSGVSSPWTSFRGSRLASRRLWTALSPESTSTRMRSAISSDGRGVIRAELRPAHAVHELADDEHFLAANDDVAHAPDVRVLQRREASRVAHPVGDLLVAVRLAARHALDDDELRSSVRLRVERRTCRHRLARRARAEVETAPRGAYPAGVGRGRSRHHVQGTAYTAPAGIARCRGKCRRKAAQRPLDFLPARDYIRQRLMSRMPRFAQFAWGLLAYDVAVVVWGAYVRATRLGRGLRPALAALQRRGHPPIAAPRDAHRALASRHQRPRPRAHARAPRLGLPRVPAATRRPAGRDHDRGAHARRGAHRRGPRPLPARRARRVDGARAQHLPPPVQHVPAARVDRADGVVGVGRSAPPAPRTADGGRGRWACRSPRSSSSAPAAQ